MAKEQELFVACKCIVDGRIYYRYGCEYNFEGCRYSFDIWATSDEEVARRLEAIRFATNGGRIEEIIPAGELGAGLYVRLRRLVLLQVS